jgi:hypothetical protein
VQGWCVTQGNKEAFLKSVQEQLDSLENTVAEVAGIAYDQLEAIRVSYFLRQICLFRRMKPLRILLRILLLLHVLSTNICTKAEVDVN